MTDDGWGKIPIPPATVVGDTTVPVRVLVVGNPDGKSSVGMRAAMSTCNADVMVIDDPLFDPVDTQAIRDALNFNWPDGFPDLRKEQFDHEVRTTAQEIDDSVRQRFPDVDWDMVKRQMLDRDPLTADEFRKIHMCEPLPYEPERQDVPAIHKNRPQQGHHIRKFRK